MGIISRLNTRPACRLLVLFGLWVLAGACLPFGVSAQPEPHETWLVSRASGADGDPSDNQDESLLPPVVSANGRFVAFSTIATNLHPDVTDLGYQTYVRDLHTHETILASRANGVAGDPADSYVGGLYPSISGDGRFVAFFSMAPNLHPEGQPIPSVYVRDIQENVTTLASRAEGANGAPALAGTPPRISAHGRYVVFMSSDPDLHPDVTDSELHIYVRDLQQNTTTLVSRASGINGPVADDSSGFFMDISADGRFVLFQSHAGNLDPAADGSEVQLYIRDGVSMDIHD